LHYPFTQLWQHVEQIQYIEENKILRPNLALSPAELLALWAGNAIAMGSQAIIAIEDNREYPGSANGGANAGAVQACHAYAATGRGPQAVDLAKQQEFWEWWLTQAVPEAWVRGPAALPPL